MISEVQAMLDGYNSWLRNNTILRDVGDCAEITTPFTDRHNDMLQIYVRKIGTGYELSDDGYIIDDLRLSGCNLDSAKRKEILRTELNGLGVQQKNDRLFVNASAENFASQKHNLIQAMLAVNDLFYLSSSNVSSLFYEDVDNWLTLSEVRFTQQVQFVGKSGFNHRFHCVIPKSSKEPERLVEPITKPNKDSVELLVFKLIDIREIRPVGIKCYAILNDQDDRPRPAVIEALRNYEVEPILWSERDGFVAQLVA